MKNMMLLKVLGIINKLPSRKKMLKMQLLLTIFVFSGYYLSALLLEKFYVNMAKSLNSFAFPVLYLISVLIFKFIALAASLIFGSNKSHKTKRAQNPPLNFAFYCGATLWP